MKNLKVRLPVYFIGLFIMTVGVAVSVKSNLGVSPVSSIPYTMTCVWGIEMGNATILFHCALVIIQILILRRRFKIINLFQIPVGIVFGKFTTLCNYLVSFLPDPGNIVIKILMVVLSAVLVAIGIFFYVPVNIIPLAGEGCMGTISQVTGIEFAKVKIAFDCSMVIVSTVVCLVFIHSLGSVGIGTIISAFLVGMILGVMVRKFGARRDEILGL